MGAGSRQPRLQFRTISIVHGRLQEVKVLKGDEAVVALEGKKLYIGTTGQWTVKVQDIESIKISHSDHSVTVQATGHRQFQMANALVDAHDDLDKFEERLTSLRSRYQNDHPDSFPDYIHSSSNKSFGQHRPKEPGRSSTTSSIIPHRVSTGTQPSITSKVNRQPFRRAFGKSSSLSLPKIQQVTQWDFDDDNDDDDHDRNLGDRLEPEVNNDEVSPKEESPTASPMSHTSETTRESNLQNSDNAILPRSTKRPRLRKLRRIGNPGRSDQPTDSSDDEDMFGKNPMTTPASQRMVSPRDKSTSTFKQRDDQEEGGDSSDKSPTVDLKNQAKIGHYFQPRTKAPTSFDPVKRNQTPATPSHPREFLSPAATRMIKSVTKRSLQQDEKWLHTSPTRCSSIEKRRAALFGKSSMFDDPIEDVADSPPTAKTPLLPRYTSSSSFSLKRTSNDRRQTFPRQYTGTDQEKELELDLPIMKKHHFRGLSNLGNTCYLNSSVQLVCTVPGFIDCLKGKGGLLTSSLVHIAKQLMDQTKIGAVNPRFLKQAVDKKTSKFAGYEQRDAHEFLSDLLDLLHEELQDQTSNFKRTDKVESLSPSHPDLPHNSLSGAKTHTEPIHLDDIESSSFTTLDPESKLILDTNLNLEGSTTEPAAPLPGLFADGVQTSAETKLELENSPMKQEPIVIPGPTNLPTDDFLLTVQVGLTCDSCGYNRHLSIDILEAAADSSSEKDRKASVERGLQRFFAPEVREVKCEKCQYGTHASQTMHVVSRPKVLLLHLKRFLVVEKPMITISTDQQDENSHPNTPTKSIPTEYVFQKNKMPVTFSDTVSLDSFYDPVIEKSTASLSSLHHHDQMNYTLCGIVHHHGKTASSGHYSVDTIRDDIDLMVNDNNKVEGTEGKHEDHSATTTTNTTKSQPMIQKKVWVTFDDASTRICPSHETIFQNAAKQATAYMLLYTLASFDTTEI